MELDTLKLNLLWYATFEEEKDDEIEILYYFSFELRLIGSTLILWQ